MHQEGAIILGTGGDNSNWSAGSFFEGVMTAGYPTDAADNAVQANIVSVGYTTASTGATGPIVAGVSSADCVDNNNGSATPGNKVQIWACDGNTAAQNWTVASNGTLQIDGGCWTSPAPRPPMAPSSSGGPATAAPTSNGSPTTASWSTRPQVNAWTIPASTPRTELSSCCGPATAAPTSTGSSPNRETADRASSNWAGPVRSLLSARRLRPGPPRPGRSGLALAQVPRCCRTSMP